MIWWPEDVWAQTPRGSDCPICAPAHRSNEHSDLVEETDYSAASGSARSAPAKA